MNPAFAVGFLRALLPDPYRSRPMAANPDPDTWRAIGQGLRDGLEDAEGITERWGQAGFAAAIVNHSDTVALMWTGRENFTGDSRESFNKVAAYHLGLTLAGLLAGEPK